MNATAGPALLHAGFRPFFLLAAIAAIVVMVRTALALHGIGLPAGNPFSWHGHEMLFGYVAAAMAGFLFTAIPNWTATRPVTGAPLALIGAVWLLARIGLWDGQPEWWAIAADLIFLPAVALLAGRPLLDGGPFRRWLPLGVILVFAAANLVWHAAVALGQPALASRALFFTTMVVALQVAVIGGRVVPAFTRNHLAARGTGIEPRAADRRDGLALAVSAAVALAEFVHPTTAAGLAAFAAVLHGARLYGWQGARTWRDPLLFVLHVGYGWLALGYAIRASALIGPQWSGPWALHGLLVGVIGTMTLAVMARATLGHTGRALQAGTLLTVGFIAMQGATVIRLLGPWVGPDAWRVAGALWLLAFAAFLVRCGPMLVSRRVDAQAPARAGRG